MAESTKAKGTKQTKMAPYSDFVPVFDAIRKASHDNPTNSKIMEHCGYSHNAASEWEKKGKGAERALWAARGFLLWQDKTGVGAVAAKAAFPVAANSVPQLNSDDLQKLVNLASNAKDFPLVLRLAKIASAAGGDQGSLL